MNEFTFVRRFDSPRYIAIYVAFLLATIGSVFLAATIRKPQVLLLSLFLGGVTALGLLAIYRADHAGIRVTTNAIHWWCTGSTPRSMTFPLDDVVSIEFQDNLDSNRIFIATRDQRLVECDHTFFGDGHDVLDAIGEFCPGVGLIHNGLPR